MTACCGSGAEVEGLRFEVPSAFEPVDTVQCMYMVLFHVVLVNETGMEKEECRFGILPDL